MLKFTVDLALQAGALLLAGLERQRIIEMKSAAEVVTDVDRASEELIVAAIEKHFPDHDVLAEEGSGSTGNSEFLWLIDPLDGTNNYAHGMPFFSVSIGLLQAGEPLIGVVYDPLRDELFSAERGEGAFCNGKRIHVSAIPTLAQSLVSTGFPYDYATTTENNLHQFDRIQARTQGVRRAGAASLDLAYVAMGRLDGHWELRLRPWDTGAAALLITEAGGRLSDWQGKPWNFWSDRLVASNGYIHDELIGALT